MKIAITGASGKTGYRITEEAVNKGIKVKQIVRKNSKVTENLKNTETFRISLDNKDALDKALENVDALIIATGARASLDLTGPAKVDALGVYGQLQSCKRVGIKRVILVSSLCTGKLFHPLNLIPYCCQTLFLLDSYNRHIIDVFEYFCRNARPLINMCLIDN